MADNSRNPDTFRIILLGTGSPRPNPERQHPAALVQWSEGGEDGQMLVDAGDGVVGQLLAANIPLQQVQNVALTHMQIGRASCRERV